ncbi:hypothetical protein L202_07369 [Cryptococcus amylolentus CBS 6039]|uniref:Major facilitator superfamily (MFS) profile domain-containing protein n=2 Tax=Cryptococcus amylolentus TaxID=104669 RepID=A0A1E3HCJ5_9TREE|nr:hypothetical protein L202_07369 [Cryptococcus amylolentus CBS 6039]ODN73845.1 hypothetical protein L202_07369 [Cryptococcus amylolentus CBS 6039]ODO00296.1 hypothetical protein I350_06926 [Cryptococcus amylolentus CBS 6273]
MSSSQPHNIPQDRTDASGVGTGHKDDSTSRRGVALSSSSATLCHSGEHNEKASPDVSPKSGPSQLPTSHPSTNHHLPHRAPQPPPVPPIGVVSVFDPASLGGGGPLKRIETQRSERYAEEEREREAREAAGETGKGGILRRWSTVSRRRPVVVLPPHSQRHSEDEPSPIEGERVARRLSTTFSFKTAPREKDDDYRFPSENDIEPQTSEKEAGEHEYPDGGYGWVVLGACCCLSGCTLGWGMCYGVFQEYYLSNVYLDADTSVLSLAGTLCAFMMNATSFFSGRYGDRFGFKRVLYCSAIVSWLGLFLAGWSTKLWQTILTQGLLTGIGQGLALPLFMSLPSQWFYRRRGLASGIAIGGAGLGGGTATLVCRQLLTTVGHKKTLWIMACINLFFMTVSTMLVRTRPTSPEGRATGKGPWVDWRVVKTSSFWSLVIGLVVACTGYAMPYNFTSQWTRLHFPELRPILLALPVTLMGFTVCIGRAIIGLVADYLGPLNTFILCFLLSGAVQLCLWLTASSFASILVFAVAFGLVAPGYMGIIPQIIVQLFGADNLATNVGILLLFNGPGNLISGPIGGALYDSSGRTTFKYMIITSGCLQLAGGLICCWARFKASHKVFKKL